ncbi:DinB superfamily protein [compost metagenome]
MSDKTKLIGEFGEWIDFVASIQNVDWQTPLGQGKWAIHDVVSHIMLWDKSFYEEVIEPIANHQPVTQQEFDFDAFNNQAIQYGKQKTKDELIQLSLHYRNLILNCIKNLDAAQYGHTYLDGKFTFESYLKDFIWHDQHHMNQIKELIK